MKNTKKCIFCEKKKAKGGWNTDIAIFMQDGTEPIFVTVCPVCRRNKTIQDLYFSIVQSEHKKLMKNLERTF